MLVSSSLSSWDRCSSSNMQWHLPATKQHTGRYVVGPLHYTQETRSLASTTLMLFHEHNTNVGLLAACRGHGNASEWFRAKSMCVCGGGRGAPLCVVAGRCHCMLLLLHLSLLLTDDDTSTATLFSSSYHFTLL